MIYPSFLWKMCAVLISVICSSVANGWPGNNWRFWPNPFLIISNASVISGTVFVLNFHILLTWVSRSLYLLSFLVSFVLNFESSGMTTLIRRQVFSFLPCSAISGQCASIVQSVITDISHIKVVLLTFMTLSGTNVTPCVYISSRGCDHPPYWIY